MADPLAASLASLCGALCGLRDQVQALATVHTAVDEFNGVFGAFQNAMALHASCLAFPTPPKPTPPMPAPPRISTGIPKPQIAPPSITAAPPRLSSSSTGSGGRASDASGGAPTAAPTAHKGGGTKKRPSGGPAGAPSGPGAAKKKAPAASGSGAAAGGGAGNVKKKAPAKSRAAAAAAAMQAQKNARPETAPWKWDKNVRDAIPRKYQSDGELAKLENVLIYLKNRQGGVTIADLVKHSGLAVIRCKEILQTLTKINLIARTQESAGFLYTFGPPEEM